MDGIQLLKTIKIMKLLQSSNYRKFPRNPDAHFMNFKRMNG